ncbi:MAG TPA: hypothetical protein VNQ79_13940 [Blastocatellia bacterium]|nr:hypothetical protein [Blastocatellia bacterium]
MLTSLNPISVVAGGPGFRITATGANFTSGSVLRWNGSNRATTVLSSTQLTATIPATDTAAPGTAAVTVFTPVATGATDGGTSNALSFSITAAPNPVPALTGLNPNPVNAGSPGFTLTVNGSSFISTSVVQFNGTPRPMTFISATQLQARFSAADIAVAGTGSVTVVNAAPGGGTSNALTLTISAVPNPVPTLSSVSPQAVIAGSAGFGLMLSGANFFSGSVARWNGANRATTFISATQLMATIPASDVTTAGTASLTVFNPAPGGGTSQAVSVSINNPAPVIMSLFPTSVVAGSSSFTLNATGSGFAPASVALWNGAPRQTTYLSRTQLVAAIPAGDVLTVGSANISVTTPAPGGGNSTAIAFSIIPQPLPPPVLTSVQASAVTQGARQVRLTIVGANFRPGVRVVIGQTTANPALAPAADIVVESVSRISDTTLIAVISAGSQASLNVRAVDVVNSGNSSTGQRGSNTTQPLRVQQSSSLGAPLQVLSLVITHPRRGTVIAQGDQISAEAILAGAGTGTITGQWLWDGAVIEQFALNLTGGERVTLRTTRGLPTIFLGPHTLELRITYPNLMQTPPISILVNPGNWKLMRLLAPGSGAGFTPGKPPLLRWTIVPGAAKYQVGFSPEPFLRRVRQWHDVSDTEWQVPEQIWSALPEGDLFWTVRAIESSGEPRVPALLRRIHRAGSGALEPVANELSRTASGSLQLQWQGLRSRAIYRLSISRDPDGQDVIRRFLVAEARADLRSIQNRFHSGETYFWRVEAFSPGGRFILSGAPQSFNPPPARVSGESRRDKNRPVEIASLVLPPLPAGFGAEEEVPPELIARAPGPDVIVTEARPPISVEFKNRIAAADVLMLIDETDVTALSQITESRVSFRPVIPLENGAHQISVGLGSESVGWRFSVMSAAANEPPSETGAPGTDAESETAKATGAASPSGSATGEASAQAGAASDGNQFHAESGSTTQWVSGQEQDTNVITLAAQGGYNLGNWRLELNGTGTINSILGPQPQHVNGQFNDYVFHLSHTQEKWIGDLKFGVIVPDLFTNAEFITTAFPRQAVQAAFGTPAGRFSFFRNINDKGQGEGLSLGYRQELTGAGYDAPLVGNSDRIRFRLMWLSARCRRAADEDRV